jgi:hypothetical protein
MDALGLFAYGVTMRHCARSIRGANVKHDIVLRSSGRSLRHLRILLLAMAVLIALAAPACSSKDVASGLAAEEACHLNSDCARGLVCALGACRAMCTTAADCGSGGTCIDNANVAVCQSAADKNTPCNKQSDCPAPLACASDYRCRNLCNTTADCNVLGITGRVCAEDAQGVYYCADQDEASNGSLTAQPPAGAKTGSPVEEPDGGDGPLSATAPAGAVIASRIGPMGGSLGIGAVSVTIPQGALDQEIVLSISPITPPPVGAVGLAYDLGPTGTQFNVPIEIAFSYANGVGGPSPSNLAVATLAGNTWQALSAPSTDPQAFTVGGKTTHLSPYALVLQTSIGSSTDGGALTSDSGGVSSKPQPISCVGSGFGEAGPGSYAVNSSVIVSTGDSGIFSCPLGGGTETPIISGLTGVVGYVADDTNLFVEQGTNILSVPLQAGGSISSLLGGDAAGYLSGPIATDGTNVYFFRSSQSSVIELESVPVGGGSESVLTPLSADSGASLTPVSIVTDGQRAYWAAGGSVSTGATIFSVPLGGGPLTTLAVRDPQTGATNEGRSSQNIVTDGSFVYWTTFAAYYDGGIVTGSAPTGGVVTLAKVPVTGGSVTTVSTTPNQEPSATIATDGAYVYWINEGAAGSSIVRAAVSGGPATTFYSVGPGFGIDSIFVEGPYLYWIAGGSLSRQAR